MPIWPTKKLAYECDCGLQNVNQYCATDGENIEYFVTIGEMYLMNDIIINAEICKRGPFFWSSLIYKNDLICAYGPRYF